MAKSLKDILKRKVFKDIERTAAAIGSAAGAWEKALPEIYRGHAIVTAFKRRILEVSVDSSAVLAELEGFHRHDIEAHLRQACIDADITVPVRIKYTVEEHS